MQHRSENRHELMLRGFAFFSRYEQLRGDIPEVHYNIGRAFHQIGIYHLALPYYEKVISMNSDYVQEAARNLGLLYVSTGCNELAHMVFRKHLDSQQS